MSQSQPLIACELLPSCGDALKGLVRVDSIMCYCRLSHSDTSSPAQAQKALTCELVAGDIGSLEAGAKVWKWALQLVVLQLHALEVGQVHKLGRDVAVNAVVCQVQALQ